MNKSAQSGGVAYRFRALFAILRFSKVRASPRYGWLLQNTVREERNGVVREGGRDEQ